MLAGPMTAARRLRPRQPQRPTVDVEWFKERIAFSQYGTLNVIARQITNKNGKPLEPSALSRTLTGQRRLALDEARQLGELLSAPMSEVMERAGLQAPVETGKVPLVGSIAGDGAVRAQWDRVTTQRVAMPPGVPSDAVALTFRTAGGELDHLDGATVICQRPVPPSPDAVGRAVIAVMGKDMAYGILRRSSQRGRHSLLVGPGLAGAKRLEDVTVTAVAVAMWVRMP